jgi:signal transduction histidine kinase
VAVPVSIGAIGLPAARRVRWVALVAATAGATASASACLWPLWSMTPTIAAPTVLFAGALVAAGVILRGEPGQGRAANTLILAGALWPLSWIGVWGSGPAPLIATLASPLALVLTAWAIYRYPDPGQVGRREQWFLRSLALWIIVGRTSVVLTSHPSWQGYPSGTWWPTLYADHGLNQILTYASAGGEALLAPLFLSQWFWRVRRIRGLDRRLMGPVVIAALVAGTASALSPIAQLAHLSDPALTTVFSVQATLLLAVPTAFAVAALRRRLTSTVIADLVERLRGEPTPENLEQAFQQVLADPELRVYYWSPDLHGYVDRDGRDFDESQQTSSLLLPVATAQDEPLAVIRADQALGRYPDLVDAAVCVGALAVQNARLQVAIRAQLAQVRASRGRIIEAGLAERQALERDLHTGALTRIRTLLDSLTAQQDWEPDRLTGIVNYATGQLVQVADELQDIAGGLHPSILSTVGLSEAVCRMSRAQPIPVLVNLPPRPFPSSVEVAAYYVISEAITNAVRHARASQVLVRGVDTGTSLLVTIKDDGRGGANVGLGTGLVGLRERLSALDGDFSVRSPRGEGTVLIAEIPCE